MGRGTKLPPVHGDTFGIPKPIVPTENKGIMSGPMRKPRGGRRIDKRGSRRGSSIVGLAQVTMRDPKTGQMYGGLVKDGVAQFKAPDGSTPQLAGLLPSRPIGKRRRPLTGGYNPESGVRYTDTGIPTAVEQTRRVPVQDPTLGGPPEREVPIPKERRQRITRESDPRGGAPFSPDERAMARDRFFETMFDRADERKQQKAMERAERDNVSDALRSERELRASEVSDPRDERQGRRGDIRRRDDNRAGRRKTDSRFLSGEMGTKKRRGSGMRSMRRRRGRRRDFTRRRSQMEGGRRGSGKKCDLIPLNNSIV